MPLATVSMVFTILFLVEVVMKMIALTPKGYWQSRRNRLDMFATISGVIWIILHFTLKALKIDVKIFSLFLLFFFNYNQQISYISLCVFILNVQYTAIYCSILYIYSNIRSIYCTLYSKI